MGAEKLELDLMMCGDKTMRLLHTGLVITISALLVPACGWNVKTPLTVDESLIGDVTSNSPNGITKADAVSILDSMSESDAERVNAAVAGDASGGVESTGLDIPWPGWDNATVYFVIIDRFFDGNSSNNNSYGRPPDGEGRNRDIPWWRSRRANPEAQRGFFLQN